MQQNDKNLNYSENDKGSFFENFLNESMEAYFATTFEDFRRRMILLLLSLTDLNIL